MEPARELEPSRRTPERILPPQAGDSPLARARLQRQLTVEQAAERAGLSPDEVHWLEEARVYRFPSADRALLAAILYATALGLDHDEALRLAGLPAPPRRRRSLIRRAAIAAAVLAALAAAAGVGALATRAYQPTAAGPAAAPHAGPHRPSLPPPWTIHVVVLNGAGDINYTRNVASQLQALSYRIARVAKANRFDYRRTQVFFPPGGEAIAQRLAQQLGDVPVQPLPGGLDPRRLVVIVGPHRGLG